MPRVVYSATGHRPDKLGGYSKEVFLRLMNLAENFLEKDRPDAIISGMALGWDTAWAEAGLNQGIPVIAAVPFLGQEKMWPKQSQDHYQEILKNCVDIIYVCDKGYAPWKMQVRNEYMIDNSHKVIALWNGSTGGTGNCIKYAQQKDREIVNLWDQYEPTSV